MSSFLYDFLKMCYYEDVSYRNQNEFTMEKLY